MSETVPEMEPPATRVKLTGPLWGTPSTEMTASPETTTVFEMGASVVSLMGGLTVMVHVPFVRARA